MDGLPMHNANRLSKREVQEVIRATASDGTHAWVYVFPENNWQRAVRRIMYDVKRGALPEDAAKGLLEVIASGVNDDN